MSVASAPIVIVGRGRLGRALAQALKNRGKECSLISSSQIWPLKWERSAIVVLAVRDAAIASVASELAPNLTKTNVVLHAAGRFDESVLLACRPAAIGVMHPLVSIIEKSAANIFDSRTLVLAGDPRAVSAAKKIARAVHAHAVVAPVHGARYHAAASLVAVGAIAILDAAAEAFVKEGLEPADAKRALVGLLDSVVTNTQTRALSEALTGSIVRGDTEAVQRHREALSFSQDALGVYDAVSRVALRMAKKQGLPSSKVRAVQKAIASAPQKSAPRRARRAQTT